MFCLTDLAVKALTVNSGDLASTGQVTLFFLLVNPKEDTLIITKITENDVLLQGAQCFRFLNLLSSTSFLLEKILQLCFFV